MACPRSFAMMCAFLQITICSLAQANPTMNPVVGQLANQTKKLRMVQYIGTDWTTLVGSKTTATFSVNANDLLVAYASQGTDSCSPYVSVSGGGLTWTLKGSFAPGTNLWAPVFLWSTTAASSNSSMSVTFTFANSVGCSMPYGGGVYIFRNSSGLGTAVTNNTTGTPSLNLTTTTSGSSVVVLSADWNAVNGSSHTWLLNTSEQSYGYLSSQYTIYGGYIQNIGNAATYTLGLSAPGGQKFSIIGVEVKP